MGGLLLLAVEIWLPWAVARLWAEWFLFYCWRVCRVLSLVLSPLVLAARFFDTLLHRLAGRQPERPTEESFEEEIRTIVTEGHREGLLEEDAREMIEGIIDLGDADVSEIMTPRTDMVSLPLDKTLGEALQFIVNVAHTRIPVYNKNRDDVVGILYAKDLLPKLAQHEPVEKTPLAEILREPYFVPETKRVDDLLQEFQRTRNHMAVVLDEYGGVSGVVTIEDVLEEIVGEIVDEYDEELVEGIKRIDDRTSEALARVHVDEINARLGLDLPEDGEFDTIGGYVFHELGHVPRVGEKLVRSGVRLTVLEATRRRIERVKIEMIDRAGKPPEGPCHERWRHHRRRCDRRRARPTPTQRSLTLHAAGALEPGWRCSCWRPWRAGSPCGCSTPRRPAGPSTKSSSSAAPSGTTSN